MNPAQNTSLSANLRMIFGADIPAAVVEGLSL